MRTSALLVLAAAFTVMLGCSENGFTNVPTPPEVDDKDAEGDGEPTDPNVAPDVPSPPPVDTTPVEPIADAGPDRLWGTADIIELDGTASYDPNDEGITAYAWTVSGSPTAITLAADDSATPSFSTAVPGTYTFELVVQNQAGLWDTTPATVALIVEDDPVLEPVANAGPDQSLDEGDIVRLDASGSFDPQGLEPLSFTWQIITRPSGSQAMLTDNGAVNPEFIADIDGNYVIELAVENSVGTFDSTPDQVIIAAAQQFLPPVADAGIDVNTSTGNLVSLDGSGSTDPQGLTPLIYSWSITQRPSGSSVVLALAGTAHPTFTPDVPGEYRMQLDVGNTENLWDLTPDEVVIDASELVVQEPIANAGADFGVVPLDTVTLDGTASYDPNGLDPLVYQWTMIDQPAGSTSMLSNREVASPTFFADLAGPYTFELTVMNTDGTWDTTPDPVIIEAIPLDGFYVEVSWDADNDLDLHILDGNSALWSDGDANYCNQEPSWGAGGTDDDPSLDADAVYGYGPETTTIESPADGDYHINVHYYGLNGSSSCGGFSCPATTATVKVYLGGVLTEEFNQTMDEQGQVWDVATISWPSRSITPVDTMGSTSETYCD